MRTAATLLTVLCLNALVFGHGGSFTPPGQWPTPPPFHGPGVPIPNPKTPSRPSDIRDPVRPDPRTGTRKRPRSGTGSGWRTWWELNREHLLGIRGLLRKSATITGKMPGERLDPMEASRAMVLMTLRKTARKSSERTVRAAAILALGRMGTDADAEMFLEILKDQKQSIDVIEAAAVALGVVRIKAAKTAAREYLQKQLRRPTLSKRARGLTVLTTGLRARDDSVLVMALLQRMSSGKKLKTDEATHLVYAAGLAQDAMIVPELLPPLRKGVLGRRRVKDMTRAYAALALGMSGDRNAARLLSIVLGSRSTDIHTRRSCALAMGRLLRETELDKASHKQMERALLAALGKGRDPPLRGFCAVALGGARHPLGTRELMEAIDHGGSADIKPYCALGLGLSARTLGKDKSKKIAAFLLVELRKARQFELSSALSIAVGLAGSDKAVDELMGRVTKRSRNASVRGAAAQGLGLIGTKKPEVHKALEGIVANEKNPDLLEDIVLALGLMGRRGFSSKLVSMLSTTKSTRLQGRIIMALGRLDSSTAVDPLLRILKNKRERPLVREFAAVALGMMGDRRETDLLFSLDAYFNFYATTVSTHELVRLY